MKNLQAFQALIAQPKNVVIIPHYRPDADALGSSLGLARYLEKKQHNVVVITPSEYPDFLAWMCGNENVLKLTKESDTAEKEAAKLIQKADIIFCVDFSSLSRINNLGDMVRAAGAVKVLIDHHLEPESFADFEKWDIESASSAGLVFELIESMGEKHLIDRDIAYCLYAGLMTDTGGFRHGNTRQKEFQIASELVGLGAHPATVSKLIYDSNSLERLRLIGFVLSKKLKVLPEYKTAYVSLTWDELKQFDVQTGDTEGLVNYGLSIKDVRLSVLMYDRNEEIKMSFRSIDDFSVNDLARKYFNGGGHRNAAGGSSKQTLQETLEKFLSILPEYKDALNKASLVLN